MKKITLLLAIVSITFAKLLALDLPAGTYYYDNSKTQYSTVKFVYGTNDPEICYIMSMTEEDDDIWRLDIPTTVSNSYRYFFSNTSYSVGTMSVSFNTLKDDIPNRGEKRTATIWDEMPNGYIYVTETGDQWAQGYWTAEAEGDNPDSEYNCKTPSNTIPIVYINTENSQAITSKDYYLNATIYIDALSTGYESFGSSSSPIVTEVKGRGNYTWTGFDKKPYKFKLDKSDRIMGMGKSKHYTLLAHADDDMAFLRNTVGFELSRIVGLPYTPMQIPVELMLNGEYLGLYFLTEQIKVTEERLNITEQEDGETDADIITGGWLVEIDNYDDDYQIQFMENSSEIIRFTLKSPEILSTQQETYITNLLTTTNAAIYNSNKYDTTWEEYIDLEQLINFYLVQEVMDDAESFHGSCYIYKDRGDDEKFMFGPVWDFGNSFRRDNGKFIYQDPPYGQNWIDEIAEFYNFQSDMQYRWNVIYPELSGLNDFINDFIDEISTATAYDYCRWSQYGTNDLMGDVSTFKSYLNSRISWLHNQWENETVNTNSLSYKEENLAVYPNPTANGIVYLESESGVARCTVYNMMGQVMQVSENSNAIDLGANQGVYLLKIELNSGTIITSKVIRN